MIIHVVKAGETINSIADYYHKSVERLILENELENPNKLVIGQTLIIVYPRQSHTVQEDDTLQSIAERYGVSIQQLLRNNPYLSDQEYLYPGETLVIDYEEEKIQTISTTGIAFPFISIDVLRKTLPFLTYLYIFTYNFTAEGELNDINDSEIIQLARTFGVAPIMMVSILSLEGKANTEATHSLLQDELAQNQLISNILKKLNVKQYYGLSFDSQYVFPEDKYKFVNFISKLKKRLNAEGFKVNVTITPNTFELETGTFYEGIDYSGLGQEANDIMILQYAWGHIFELPLIVMPFQTVQEFIEYVISVIPPEKVLIGITNINYIFQLPYIEDASNIMSIRYSYAIELAAQVNATIQYDEKTQASYFYYLSNNKQYFIWFKDARGLNNLLNLVPQYHLYGLGVWNIMYYLSQLFLLINVQYEIQKVI